MQHCKSTHVSKHNHMHSHRQHVIITVVNNIKQLRIVISWLSLKGPLICLDEI